MPACLLPLLKAEPLSCRDVNHLVEEQGISSPGVSPPGPYELLSLYRSSLPTTTNNSSLKPSKACKASLGRRSPLPLAGKLPHGQSQPLARDLQMQTSFFCFLFNGASPMACHGSLWTAGPVTSGNEPESRSPNSVFDYHIVMTWLHRSLYCARCAPQEAQQYTSGGVTAQNLEDLEGCMAQCGED